MRPRLLVLVVAVLNLAAGASFGFVAGRAAPVHAMPDARIVKHDLAPLADALDLPEEKDARVRAILSSCGPRFEAVMSSVHPKLLALHEEILGELKAVLTPQELQKLADEYRRRHGPFELR